MPFEVKIIAGRDDDFSGTLEDSTGAAIAITAGSDVLFKAFRGAGATPDLDLNGTQTANGSVTGFTAGSGAGIGTYTVKFNKGDTSALTPGAYQAEVLLVDAGDSSRVKHADYGVLHIIGQPLGGLT